MLIIDKDIKRIKEKAHTHGIRQWELAREIGEFPALVSHLFRGRMNPVDSEIHRMNVAIERILERRNEEAKKRMERM